MPEGGGGCLRGQEAEACAPYLVSQPFLAKCSRGVDLRSELRLSIMSSDSDLAAPPTDEPQHSRRTRLRGKSGPATSAASTSGASYRPTCHLCEAAVDVVNPTMVLHGFIFHPACNAAMRCFRRGGKAAADTAMQYDTLKWRSLVRPLVRGPGGKRDAAARRHAYTTLQHEKVTEKLRIRDRMLMTKSRYKIWSARTDRYDSSEASEAFDNMLDAHGDAYKENGESRVVRCLTTCAVGPLVEPDIVRRLGAYPRECLCTCKGRAS